MIIKDNTYKGTRVLYGEHAIAKRAVIDGMVEHLLGRGFTEISIPIIQNAEIFKNKVGEENNNMMFNFNDRGGRYLCLAPEYTAVIQKLANKFGKDSKLFYIGECFRGEKPQAGRYRQFTQFGVEILNPNDDYKEYQMDYLIGLAVGLLNTADIYPIKINKGVSRGLDYYDPGYGFEIEYEDLGAQKQIVGGGKYEGGIGFAIGIDRLLEIEINKRLNK